MNRTIFNRVKSWVRKLGIDIRRKKASPYDYLLLKPRFIQTPMMLNGKKFIIADGPSFSASYREIFLDEIYRFDTAVKRPVIIDCGANYGTSVIFFKKLYPESEIVAVEADPDIYKLLSGNIERQRMADVTLINKAVAVKRGPVTFYKQGADGGSLHALQDSRGSVQVESISIDELLCRPVDFLKVDIEGAEVDVLCGCTKLENVSKLFIEYHSFSDSEQELDRMLNKLKQNGFRYYIYDLAVPQNPFLHPLQLPVMDMQLNICCVKEDQMGV